jgi:hypothetical protein
MLHPGQVESYTVSVTYRVGDEVWYWGRGPQRWFRGEIREIQDNGFARAMQTWPKLPPLKPPQIYGTDEVKLSECKPISSRR